jgi:competence protein ComEC
MVILTLIAASVWMAVLVFPDRNLHLVTCGVGQGNASVIFYGKTQTLIDGGPNSRVLDCLNKDIPFWDREIEVVMLSHPRTDHFTGPTDVFQRYKVDYFFSKFA